MEILDLLLEMGDNECKDIFQKMQKGRYLMHCSKRRERGIDQISVQGKSDALPVSVERIRDEMTERPLSQLKEANQQLAMMKNR